MKQENRAKAEVYQLDKKRKHNKVVVAGIVAAFVAALAAPANAATATQDQTVDATLAESLSLSLSSSAVSGWALAASSLTNTKAAGTMSVSTNALTYSVTVVGEKATLTEHDGTAYVTGGKALASAMSVTAKVGTTTTGTAAVGTVAGALIPVGTTGGGSQTYDLSFTQPTTFADGPLATGRTYHNKLTYTATSAI